MPLASEQDRLRGRIPASNFNRGGSDSESEDPIYEEKDALAIVSSSSPNVASPSPKPPIKAQPEPALPLSSGTFGKDDTIHGTYTFEDDRGPGDVSVGLKLTVQLCANGWSLSQGDFVDLNHRLFAPEGYLAKAQKKVRTIVLYTFRFYDLDSFKEFCYLMRKLPSITHCSLHGILLSISEEDQIALKSDFQLSPEKPQLQRLNIEGPFSGASISTCHVELFCNLTQLKTLILVNTTPSHMRHSAIHMSDELISTLTCGPMTILWLAGVHPYRDIYCPVASSTSEAPLDFAILLDLGSVVEATEQVSFATAMIEADDHFRIRTFTLDVKVPAIVGPFARGSQTKEDVDKIEEFYVKLSVFSQRLLTNLEERLNSRTIRPFTFKYRPPRAEEHPIRKLIQEIGNLDGASDGRIVIEALRDIW